MDCRSTKNITISTYLIDRLKEVGIDTIFGVPGDFNMPLLDFIEEDKEVTWGNNTSELNAAFAADGYARIKGVGALVTTFGVGELSAVNGISGSYAEKLPVIHIVGYPKIATQKNRAKIHHSFCDGDFFRFSNVYKSVTVASAHIMSSKDALSEIDRVIQAAFIAKRPGYIALPLDLMTVEVKVPTVMPRLQLSPPKAPACSLETVLEIILEAIEKANNPTIYVDGYVLRYRIQEEARAFTKKSGFATFCAPNGVGAIIEDTPNYRGVYGGSMSLENATKEIKKADLLIELGSFKSDANTSGFTLGLDEIRTVTLEASSTTIFGFDYPNVGIAEILPLLTARLPKQIERHFPPRASPAPIDNNSSIITHNYLWNKLLEYIEPNSIIVADTGCSSFGAAYNLAGLTSLEYVIQLHWASIGYSVPATLGAAMANRNKRVYLFVGDGSYQMTAQEVSSFIHQGITPVIFLLNNDGYLMEKLIRGPHSSYNNFPMWNYSNSLEFFGGRLKHNTDRNKNCSVIGVEAKVTTRNEFECTMKKVTDEPDKIHFIELEMPQFDAPRQLTILGESTRASN